MMGATTDPRGFSRIFISQDHKGIHADLDSKTFQLLEGLFRHVFQIDLKSSPRPTLKWKEQPRDNPLASETFFISEKEASKLSQKNQMRIRIRAAQLIKDLRDKKLVSVGYFNSSTDDADTWIKSFKDFLDQTEAEDPDSSKETGEKKLLTSESRALLHTLFMGLAVGGLALPVFLFDMSSEIRWVVGGLFGAFVAAHFITQKACSSEMKESTSGPVQEVDRPLIAMSPILDGMDRITNREQEGILFAGASVPIGGELAHLDFITTKSSYGFHFLVVARVPPNTLLRF
jgi:hypothetical protein